jgi:hypothetical protein
LTGKALITHSPNKNKGEKGDAEKVGKVDTGEVEEEEVNSACDLLRVCVLGGKSVVRQLLLDRKYMFPFQDPFTVNLGGIPTCTPELEYARNLVEIEVLLSNRQSFLRNLVACQTSDSGLGLGVSHVCMDMLDKDMDRFFDKFDTILHLGCILNGQFVQRVLSSHILEMCSRCGIKLEEPWELRGAPHETCGSLTNAIVMKNVWKECTNTLTFLGENENTQHWLKTKLERRIPEIFASVDPTPSICVFNEEAENSNDEEMCRSSSSFLLSSHSNVAKSTTSIVNMILDDPLMRKPIDEVGKLLFDFILNALSLGMVINRQPGTSSTLEYDCEKLCEKTARTYELLLQKSVVHPTPQM